MLADARVSGSKACVADLGSQHGTSVQRDGIAIKMAPFQLFALQKGDELVFGASSRRYRVKVETGRTETKRDALYLKLAEPNAAKPDAEKRTVRVGNVAYEATEQEIESLFTADGSTTVIDVVLPRELRPRGPFFFGKERRSIDTICLFFSLLRVPARARSSRSEPSEFRREAVFFSFSSVFYERRRRTAATFAQRAGRAQAGRPPSRLRLRRAPPALPRCFLGPLPRGLRARAF